MLKALELLQSCTKPLKWLQCDMLCSISPLTTLTTDATIGQHCGEVDVPIIVVSIKQQVINGCGGHLRATWCGCGTWRAAEGGVTMGTGTLMTTTWRKVDRMSVLSMTCLSQCHVVECASLSSVKIESVEVSYTIKMCSWIEYRAGPRLNIKTVLSTYGDFHVKDKTAVRTSYL